MRALTPIMWVAAAALMCSGDAVITGGARAMDDTIKTTPAETTPAAKVVVNPTPIIQAKQLEFAIFNKHCTQCHNSVADPERPGKTRDQWYAIINLMESHGLNIPQDEADMIVDLLYNLRRGVEDAPG